MKRTALAIILAGVCGVALPAIAQDKPKWDVTEGDYVAKDYKFRSGESLAELKLHYRTLGTPKRDAQGHVTNTSVAKSSGSTALDAVAIALAKGATYSPALVKCKPVAAAYTFTVKFSPW